MPAVSAENSQNRAHKVVADEKTAPPREKFTLRQRIALTLITWTGYLAISLIGPTLRFDASSEDGAAIDRFQRPVILCFWHRALFMAAQFYKHQGIAVMISSSFDGEYIARILRKLGILGVRGSSTRGGVRALLAMHRDLEAGRNVAFTIDGPKGPAYVAKPGPVLLARNTQMPIRCFYAAANRAWVLKTWDKLVIPKPFAHVALRVAAPIQIPRETDFAALQKFHAEMQASLERARAQAEAAVAQK